MTVKGNHTIALVLVAISFLLDTRKINGEQQFLNQIESIKVLVLV